MSDLALEAWPKIAAAAAANETSRLLLLEQDWRQAMVDENAEINAETNATLADLWYCYRLLLNRSPDPFGSPYLIERVRAGITLRELLRFFIDCDEYAKKHLEAAHGGPARVKVNGLELYLPAPQSQEDHLTFQTGRHKPHLAGAIASILQPGFQVLDIGAGAGAFAIYAARKVAPGGRVIALEPHQEKLRLLLANMTACEVCNIEVLPFAAADGDGFVSLANSDGMTIARDVTREHLLGQDNTQLASARRLDAILHPERPVDVIKIALDGFDYRALSGASETLSRFLPHMFGEYAPALLEQFSAVDPREYFRLLERVGYTRFTAIPKDRHAIDLGRDTGALANLPAELGVPSIDFYARRS